jgi:uncharacterized damage-inducible protein DinB
MTVADLVRLYDSGYWANGRLFRILSALTPEKFTRDVAGSYASVSNTLAHAMSAEWGWLDRCGGFARGPALKPADYPTPLALVDTWRVVEGHARSFLSNLTDADLARSVEAVIRHGTSG